MAESSLIGTLVDDHGIFHVIPGIRDDSHDGIGPTGVLSEIIFLILVGVDQGFLREENAIHFIVHAIGVVVVGGTHGLLGHLALIHVTRGLIVLWERLHGGNDTQNVHWVQFLVSCISSDIFLLTSDRKV